MGARLDRCLFVALVAASAMALLFLLLWRDLVPSGSFTLTSDFTSDQPRLSRLYPEGRLAAPVVGSTGSSMLAIGEPLYLDLRLPRAMREVQVRLWYQGSRSDDLRLGLAASGPEAKVLVLVPLADVTAPPDSPWRVGAATLPLAGVPVSGDRRVRVVISSPSLRSTGALLQLHQVEVRVLGEPLSVLDVVRVISARIRGFFSYYFVHYAW